MTVRILQGDCRHLLSMLPDQSVHCVVTSPPYFGLRDYGVDGQMGLESIHDCLGWATGSPCGACFVCQMVGVFRAAHRVLRDDGTLWLNLGDSYAGSGCGGDVGNGTSTIHTTQPNHAQRAHKKIKSRRRDDAMIPRSDLARPGLKQKDLMMMPARVAMALQADGWYLRDKIIWWKLNTMPESVRDRCTKAYEDILMFAKQPQYYFDADAIREKTGNELSQEEYENNKVGSYHDHKNDLSQGMKQKKKNGFKNLTHPLGKNKRNVWPVPTAPCKEAHFATFPPALIEPCILAGCPGGGIVLDPFGGAGTTGLVADRLGRDAILIELNPEYVQIAKRRIENDAPLFTKVEAA